MHNKEFRFRSKRSFAQRQIVSQLIVYCIKRDKTATMIMILTIKSLECIAVSSRERS